jgi:protein phosphatase 1E
MTSKPFFAIYDGHGGVEAAEYARNHLHVNLVHNPKFRDDPATALKESFVQTDTDFLIYANRESVTAGCTCIVTLLRGETLYTAWLGDSQAMLCRDGQSVPGICSPHKPEREDEKQRIEALGGVVVWYGAWRVNGVLSVARAIGDKQLKKYITSEADCTVTPLGRGENFVCLACDGLWDVMDSDAVVAFVSEYLQDETKSMAELARALVKKAIQLGSADNVSLVLVFLQKNAREDMNACRVIEALETKEEEEEVDVVDSEEAIGSDAEKTAGSEAEIAVDSPVPKSGDSAASSAEAAESPVSDAATRPNAVI